MLCVLYIRGTCFTVCDIHVYVCFDMSWRCQHKNVCQGLQLVHVYIYIYIYAHMFFVKIPIGMICVRLIRNQKYIHIYLDIRCRPRHAEARPIAYLQILKNSNIQCSKAGTSMIWLPISGPEMDQRCQPARHRVRLLVHHSGPPQGSNFHIWSIAGASVFDLWYISGPSLTHAWTIAVPYEFSCFCVCV